ncbi:hypothetical protein ACFXTH_043921 [Malus domestica]
MLLNKYSLIEKKRRSCWLEKGVEMKTAQKRQSQDFSAERSVPKNGVVAVTDGKEGCKKDYILGSKWQHTTLPPPPMALTLRLNCFLESESSFSPPIAATHPLACRIGILPSSASLSRA